MSYRIGIDLGGTKIEGIAMDAEGATVVTKRVATPPDYVQTVIAIKELVSELDQTVGQSCPLGIGTPGAWVESEQVMKNCNSTCLIGRPLLHDLQRVLSRPVRIANDADCFVLSEASDGSGQGATCVFGVILGTGVGGGWVVNNRIVNGPNGLSGEWGHNPIPRLRDDPNTHSLESNLEDRICYCGRVNCVETFLSGPGLEQTHLALTGQTASAMDFADSEEGEQTMDLYIAMLARALAVVVNIMDPDVIVLGGGVSNIGSLYDRLPAEIEKYAFSSEGQTAVRRAKFGASSGVRGAAWLFP